MTVFPMMTFWKIGKPEFQQWIVFLRNYPKVNTAYCQPPFFIYIKDEFYSFTY